ncbi:MAG: InlB B-repeat-containing protein [Thermodesulfobacteriota bacterium]|jgi:uncharacterized repeat protein (TIGR02543 family)
MKVKLFLIFIIIFAFYQLSFANTYTTTFPLTENPISESGMWINGGTVGLDWCNVQTNGGSPGLAYGTETGSINYNDSTALLTGTWGPNQTVTATVYTTITGNSNYEEVELRVRSSLSAHNCTGYEINFSVNPSNPYVQIVRWNGALGDFTELNGTGSSGAKNGDVILATISGSTITAYINGTAVLSATDSTYSTGSPGMGFYVQGVSGIDSQYGFTYYSATDGTTPTQYTVTFQTDGTLGATLTGTTTQTVNQGANCTAVTANAPANYHFVNWTGTGGFSSTSNPVTVTNVTQNMTITANFAVTSQYTVTFQTDGTPGATLTGNTTQTVNQGANCTAVTANAPANYHFVNWTGTGGFSSTSNPVTVTNVTQNMTITANFAATPQYTVTFQTDGTPGATLTGTTTQTVNQGGNCTAVTAKAPANYYFVNWTGTGGFSSTKNPVTVTNVTQNMTITANFAHEKPSPPTTLRISAQ